MQSATNPGNATFNSGTSSLIHDECLFTKTLPWLQEEQIWQKDCGLFLPICSNSGTKDHWFTSLQKDAKYIIYFCAKQVNILI